jgi:hypothetical protein
MALPIQPTPRLDRKESEQFLKEFTENANRKAVLTPTPKLKEAEKVILAYEPQPIISKIN